MPRSVINGALIHCPAAAAELLIKLRCFLFFQVDKFLPFFHISSLLFSFNDVRAFTDMMTDGHLPGARTSIMNGASCFPDATGSTSGTGARLVNRWPAIRACGHGHHGGTAKGVTVPLLCHLVNGGHQVGHGGNGEGVEWVTGAGSRLSSLGRVCRVGDGWVGDGWMGDSRVGVSRVGEGGRERGGGVEERISLERIPQHHTHHLVHVAHHRPVAPEERILIETRH